MMSPKVFDPCGAQTLRRRRLKFVTLNITQWSIKKVIFGFLSNPGVTIVASLSGSTLDFLKLSFNIFPYSEILKVFKSKI